MLKALFLITGLFAWPLAQAPGKKFEVTKVAEGVYVIIKTDTLKQPMEGNVTVIINDEDVVVVDGSQTPSSARTMIAEIRKLTDKPVRYLINTHWHGDHHHGNFVYKETFPGIEIIAHRYTREDISTFGARSLQGQIREFQNRNHQKKALEAGVDRQGRPLPEAVKHRLRQRLEIPDNFLQELQEVKLTLPTLTFDRDLVLQRGSRVIHIFSNGPGNTRSDAIIHLPQEKIVITGDLLVSTVPFMSESRPRGWLARLKEIAALDAAIIIPGHGPIQRDRKYLDMHMALLESLIKQVDAALKDSLSLEEAEKRVTLEEFRRQYSNGDSYLMNEFDYRITRPAIADAYREAKGEK